MNNESTLPFKGIVESISDALIYADLKGRIVYWNAGAERLFGFSAGEAVGVSLDLIVPEKLRVAHWRGYEAAIASGSSKYAGRVMKTRALQKSGERLYIDMSLNVVKDEQDRVCGAIALSRVAAPPARAAV